MTKFTHRQGRFLAFIHLYGLRHKQERAALALVRCFWVTPPSGHGMIVKLGELGLSTREPGVARSGRVAIPRKKSLPGPDPSCSINLPTGR